MHINYFDFGVHKGDEIEMFLDAVEPIELCTVDVYGFEAFPHLAYVAQMRYDKLPNVKIFNKAIYNNNVRVRLYIAEGNAMEGNSIFSSKENVDQENYVDVDGIKFSDWIEYNVPEYKKGINVIRFNIEGAEIYLFEDLITSKIDQHFDLFLGASGGVDILKCSEIAHLHDDYNRMLKNKSIIVHQFCAASKNNISPERIREIIKLSQ
jgi:FkbM family methyltransferase